jgi:ECF transporter S component (folate family)
LALVIAIKIILSRFSFGPTYVKVGLGFIGSVALGYFFGPIWGAVGGGISDLASSALFGNEGGFFIGFTLTAMLGPMIYGFFFYRKPIKIWRIIVASLLVTIFVNVLLNTVWLHFIYKMSFTAALTARLLKEVIVPWIQMIIIFFVLNGLQRVNARREKLEKSRM